MKMLLKYDYDKVCRSLLHLLLEREGVAYELPEAAILELPEDMPLERKERLVAILEAHGIATLEDKKNQLVQQIKDVVTEMVHNPEALSQYKSSVYIAERLNYSYTYLSTLFSEATYTSIENFIILKKIDHAKALLASQDLTLTEVAFTLNYSSVSHLSGQFKKVTGITPSQFLRIVERRRAATLSEMTNP